MEIRDETPNDIEAIRDVVTAAFRDAPHRSGFEAAIVSTLRDAGALAISLVAEDAGEIVGCVAFSPVAISGCSCGWFGLGPIAVTPQRQREGVGTLLIVEGLARLTARDAGGCVVLGDPGYYRRFGFETDAVLRYSDAPAAYFQRRTLHGGDPHGVVAYHSGFAAG